MPAPKKDAAAPAAEVVPDNQEPKVEPNDNPGTDLVPAADSPFAVVRSQATGDGSLARILAENTGAGGINEFDLDRVGMPPGGITSWQVPTLEGNEAITSIDGIIVNWREPRAFWETPFEQSGGGTPPDCSSLESVQGQPRDAELAARFKITGDCRTCPLAQWGSDPRDDSQAQWCKQRRFLFVIREDDFLPIVVSLAPGSLKAINKYFLRLSSKSTPYYGVVSRLKLTKATSQGGIDYAQVDPSVVRTLDPAEIVAVREYAAALRGAFDAITITEEEAAGVA